ncbi:hypothetical protein M5X00_01870 [Paenibacillus alvei]|uniref:hypothetical protein n=1 Tax=Paenibacillus TaxID=44249 RepID=UPI0002895044|nr:hypothetical protein [Paenibacillus alvei]EJW18583.1 hypothetical protein PAV_2c03490 [Paenibacillus alvei DSM 29]MCY9539747.1 hypothetical protein [Paenibacillus alvei]MCY9703269.1 hypothetical protein [Paenibacillus alvei]MCY9735510.1 hypothetical protein [Paenibacillus alvei]MCY9753009.1 hypothetical protein [Paenibacillus alvei]
MLTFEQKLAVIESFPELQRNNVSLGRVNFHYEDSVVEKKTVVYHLHPNGNGFVYAGYVSGYDTDAKGMVNIREYSEEELRKLIQASIDSMSPAPLEADIAEEETTEVKKERYINDNNETLWLEYDFELWNIYAGESLEMTFETREEAEEYLLEEGFSPANS